MCVVEIITSTAENLHMFTIKNLIILSLGFRIPSEKTQKKQILERGKEQNIGDQWQIF